MPLVRVDVIKGQRSNQELRKLADVIQQVLLDTFHAPPRDRYQVSYKRSKGSQFASLASHDYDTNGARQDNQPARNL